MAAAEAREIATLLGRGAWQLTTKILLPPKRRWALVYPICVILVSLLGNAVGASGYDKHNAANWVFTRLGWGITVAPLVALNATRADSVDKTMAYVRIILATLYWVFVTQFSIGSASLMDMLDNRYGACTLDLSAPRSGGARASCIRGGGEWRRFDASGHCFMAVHGSLLIIEELKHYRDVLRTWNSASSADRWLYGAAAAVVTAWAWMLVVTSFYFHTTAEKALGLLLGQFFWLCMGLLE